MENATATQVWVVTVWEWGGGGDDCTRVVSVHATEEDARTAAEKAKVDLGDDYGSTDPQITAYDLR